MAELNFYTRNMLGKYDKQLLIARRLARYRVAMRMASGEDEPEIDPQVRRRETVERVAKELYDSLVFTGSDNPVVADIREALGREVGGKISFQYPPGELRMRIVRENADGAGELAGPEAAVAMDKLWRITVEQVEKTML